MTERALEAEKLQQAAKEVADEAQHNPWIKGFARLGYVAIGLVYLLTALLAMRLALGIDSETPEKEAALLEILQAPFGRGLLGLTAVGLFGYVLWRLIETFLDVNDKGRDLKGLSARAGYLISALFYSGLGIQAARMTLGSYSGGGDPSQTWTARLLAQPFGRWLVIALGLAVIAAGIGQLVYGWKSSFKEHMSLSSMSPAEQRWATLAGRIGYAARGFVLGLVGWLFILAAWRFDPEQAASPGGALAELAAGGSAWLLVLAALGLAAYGLYCFVLVKYHRLLCK